MITARLLTVLAASSLAAIAYAQTQPAPSNQPTAAPGYNKANPHERQMKSVGHETASPNSRSAPGSGLNTAPTRMRMAEAGPAAHPWANMAVQSRSGQSLGSVSKVVPGLNGRKSSGYVLVSGASGMRVPVPYRTADSMVRDGKLVLSQSRFEHAPKVTQEDLQNRADHAWRIKADHYWMHQRHDQMTK
ncbi:MAG: hypothetical protein ACREV7_00245 [Steroidobacteraceae bacterium]